MYRGKNKVTDYTRGIELYKTPTVISLCWLNFLTRESSHMQAAWRTCGFWLVMYLDRIELRTQGTTSLFFTSERENKKVTVKRLNYHFNICLDN